MKLQTVKIGHENIVPSGARIDGISIRRSGIAKVLWRKVDRDVPQSERRTFTRLTVSPLARSVGAYTWLSVTMHSAAS